jgi:hypothetical protein
VDVLTPAWLQAPGAPLGDQPLTWDLLRQHVAHLTIHLRRLMQGAALRLAAGGRLITYGPYLEGGSPRPQATCQVFDQSLRKRQQPGLGHLPAGRRGEDAARSRAAAIGTRGDAGEQPDAVWRTTDSPAPRP